MTIPMLSEEIYNNPAKFEYFIRFKFFLYTEDSLFRLNLIPNSDLITWSSDIQSYPEFKYLAYCGKVSLNETLEQAIHRELRNGFGTEKINKFSFNEETEFGKNRFGETLPRVIVNVDVDLKEIKKCILGNDLAVCNFIDKLEKAKIKMAVEEFNNSLKPEKRELLSNLHLEITTADRYEDTYTMEALKYLELGGVLAGNRFENTEKAIGFVKNLYDSGAKEVKVSGVRIDNDFIGTAELVAVLPENSEKREALFEIKNEENRNEGFTEESDKEKDEGEKTIEFWWD